MLKFFLIPFLLFLLLSLSPSPKKKKGKVSSPINKISQWQRLSGHWEIKNNLLQEQQGWVSPWNYYLLLDYNTVISQKKIENFTSFKTSFELTAPIKDKTEFIISWQIQSPYKNWNYHLYGLKLTGNNSSLNQIDFFHSDQKDKKKKYNQKNNYFVKILNYKKINLSYKKKHAALISFFKNQLTITLNQKNILILPWTKKSNKGKIGFSGKNVKINIHEVEVRNKEKLLWHDNFKKDSLHIPSTKAKIKNN